jgi:hypothetical protein
MKSVFEYLKEIDSDLYFNKIDVAVSTCFSDPQNSIIKSFRVLEDLINELFKLFSLNKYSDDIFKCINQLERDVNEAIIKDLHAIRIIRNKAAHTNNPYYPLTSGDNVDSAESYFVLKKLYDLLGWYINLGKIDKIEFKPFQLLSKEIISFGTVRITTNVINVESESDEIKIGTIAQTKLKDILERMIDENDIEKLTSYEYSKEAFNISVPLISSTRSGKSKSRYYTNPVKIGSKRYYVCNGWNDGNKNLLLNWINKKQDLT